MNTLRALLFLLSAMAAFSAPEDPRSAFWGKETDRKLAAEAAKQHAFFLRLVVGGGWGPETATYEIAYAGDATDLDLARGIDVVGMLVRRDWKGEERTQIEKYDLSHLIRDCINEEFFEMGPRTKEVTAPDVLKMDGCDFFVFIKYGKVENCFRRTDDSIPVWEIYSRLKKKVRPNQSPQHNAGSRPSAGDSSASGTPSSLGPRG